MEKKRIFARLPKRYYEELFFNSEEDRELLQQNQEVITELLDKNGAVGVVACYDEPDFPIYFISAFALTSIGYEYEEMLAASGGKFLNLVYEKDRSLFSRGSYNLDHECHEYRLVNREGQNVWVKSYRRESVSVDGRRIIIASIRVVDDARKRESELLDALTSEYRHIMYLDIPKGKYRVIKSGEDVHFEEQIVGKIEDLRELLRKYEAEYVHPEDHSFEGVLRELDYFSHMPQGGGTYRATYRAKMDGEYRWMQIQVFYGGELHLDTGHIILALRIVDEEKKRELDANRILSDSLAQAEQANSIKEHFLSRMSHDLRTPINGIFGMLEIAGKNIDEPQRMRECLDKISISCDNLMSLVNDVLDMSNLKKDDFELDAETFNLDEFLAQEFRPISRRAEMGGLTYTAKIEPFAHHCVIGSPKHIQQIFDKILDNAIKYNKLNGSITFCAREMSCTDKLAVYEFVIEDKGIGMKPEFLEYIFEAFEQENNEARTKYLGTGLGMSIVKKLVDHMNGTITVESWLGEGTRVTVALPLKVGEEHKVADTASKERRLDGLKVLLAEDNEINMEITRFLLEDAGMEVVGAEDGKVALDLFAQSKVGEFSAILMDLMMPVMDGYESAREIRKLDRPDAKEIPIIAVSANVADKDIKKTKMAGMNEHLAKPVNTVLMLDTIRKCLR